MESLVSDVPELERRLAALSPGDHICLIYQNRDEQFAVMIPYLRDGLAKGQQVLYIADERSVEEVEEALRAAGVDVDAEEERGALRLATKRETYLRHGRFDPAVMITLLRGATAEAVARGYSALRVTGEMTWALGPEVGTERLIEYEALLNDFFPGSRALGVCQYNRERFRPEILQEVLQTHPVAIVGKRACHNPFYQFAQPGLEGPSAGEQVVRMLAQLRRASDVERALHASQERFAGVLAQAPDAIVSVDEAQRITLFNRAAEQAFGYAASEVLGRPLDVLLPERVRAVHRKAVEEFGRSPDRSRDMGPSRERVGLRKDGREFPVECSISKQSGDGTMQYTVVVRDATERRRWEQEFRRASSYARSLIEASLDPLVTISPQGTITDVNHATEQVTGVPRAELIGSDFADYFTEPDTARAGYRQVLAEGQVRDYPLTIRHRDGHTTDVLYHATVYRDESGAIQGVFAAARDITERKHAQEVADAERRRFNAVLETLPVYIVILTPDYHVPFANRFFRERFGKAHGRHCYEYLFGRDAPCEICESFKVLETHAPHAWEWRGPDGRDYSIFDYPFADSDGATKILEMGIDVTDQKRAEAEIRRLNAELEQRVVERTAELQAANQELEAFSYSVSHDLRAPLRGMGGFSQAVLEDCRGKLDERAVGYLNRIRAASQHMGNLIDGLLQMSRVTRGELHPENVHLSAVAAEVMDGLRRGEPERKVRCTIAPEVWGSGDPRLLRLVLENLLGNAWKFTAKHPEAHIEFGASTGPGGERVFFVQDDGVGFDMAYADKLFGAFQRLHPQADFEGTGIGLATVQRIIHRHGGRMRAEGVVERGARFSFTLGPGGA